MIDTAALREKVLDLAIRGKLVSQDPNDEPASVLLERIHEQKLQMVREGKLKAKDVKDDTIIFKGDDNCYYEKYSDGSVKNIQDEIPFDLPAGWSWARGKNCFQEMKTRKPNGEEFVYIDIDAIDNKKNTITNAKVLKVKDAPSRACRYVKCGSVLFSLVRPYLKNIAFVEEKYASSIASSGFFVCTSTGVLYPRYSFYLMISPYVVNGINQFMKGDNSPSVSKSDIENWLYPIPPYNEQKQIVDCLNKTLAIIQNIHDTENELQGEITSIKSKILELAIQGKLVPQDENDEPASVLLERIRAERKEKLGKKYVESYIFKGDDNCYYEKIGKNNVNIAENISFEIPSTWEICRFESIVEMYTGNSINESDKAKKYTGLSDGYNYIATKDISFNHTVNYDNGVKIPYGEPKFKIAYEGDPLLCIEGGSAGRKIAILSEDVCFVNKLCVFHSLGVNKKYLYYYLQSPQFCELFKKNTSGLIGGVSINTLKSLYFMLPPLSEQLRIVCAVEKVFSYIDEIEKGLN